MLGEHRPHGLGLFGRGLGSRAFSRHFVMNASSVSASGVVIIAGPWAGGNFPSRISDVTRATRYVVWFGEVLDLAILIRQSYGALPPERMTAPAPARDGLSDN